VDGEEHHLGMCAAIKDMPSTLRWAAFFAALGGILFGYDIGIISGALLQLEDEFGLSNFQKELVVSLMLLGAIAGSVLGGYIIDYFGRRRAIIGNAGLFVMGAVGLCAAPDLTTLLIARVVVGFAVALSAIAECVYISEIAPAAHRGALVSLNELGITVGIFLSYMINYALITTPHGWRWMFGLSMIPAVLQGIGMVFMPASPRWLLLRGYVAEAEASLRKFRPTSHDVGVIVGGAVGFATFLVAEGRCDSFSCIEVNIARASLTPHRSLLTAHRSLFSGVFP
jgi:MFS family permease